MKTNIIINEIIFLYIKRCVSPIMCREEQCINCAAAMTTVAMAAGFIIKAFLYKSFKVHTSASAYGVAV